MNQIVLITPASDLAKLASEINREHDAAMMQVRASLDHARSAGEYLTQAKKHCPHGEWLAWLAKNCPALGKRQAQRYMQLAARWAEVPTVSKASPETLLTLNKVLALLGGDSDEAVDGSPVCSDEDREPQRGEAEADLPRDRQTPSPTLAKPTANLRTENQSRGRRNPGSQSPAKARGNGPAPRAPAGEQSKSTDHTAETDPTRGSAPDGAATRGPDAQIRRASPEDRVVHLGEVLRRVNDLRNALSRFLRSDEVATIARFIRACSERGVPVYPDTNVANGLLDGKMTKTTVLETTGADWPPLEALYEAILTSEGN